MKHLRLALLILFAGLLFLSSIQLHRFESERRILKSDLIELSLAKYGIFNVDEWKEIISNIIAKKVDEINLEQENREVMRQKIEAFLYKVLSESEDNFNEQKSGSLFGIIQKSVASVTDIFGHLKNEVPKITNDILTFLDDPENRDQIKKYVRGLIDKYADQTFAKVDYSVLNSILEKYESRNKEEGLDNIQLAIDGLESQSVLYKWSTAVIAVLFILFYLLLNGGTKTEILIGLLASLILLASGVLLPMIDIDARIASFNFLVLGEPVSFSNQVLYYKSKSILEVVQLMMSQGQLNIFLVGFLVLLFSVLFPSTKLALCGFYLYRPSIGDNKIVRFFIFKSGKWSMADVMVVAIFMSYIGFSSILAEQLKQLETVGKNLEILTTNQSTLNMGFYLFTGFVLMGLVVSNRLSSRSDLKGNFQK